MLCGLAWQAALFAGLALSLSSTAFALQVLEEKGELALRHGRLGFAVLLFQDLAAIPLIALVPLFAVSAAEAARSMELSSAAKAIGVILAVVLVGRYVLNGMYRLIARTRVKEAMTASALLTVVGVTLVMRLADLPAELGAFLAGVLLADSDYRHQIVADIAPSCTCSGAARGSSPGRPAASPWPCPRAASSPSPCSQPDGGLAS
jgi:glutathione-regulated potassium-efflux system protein KefB